MQFLRRSLLPVFACLCAFLPGCLSYENFTLIVDFPSGTVESIFLNLTSTEKSQKGDKDSVEADWKSLQEMEANPFGKEKPKGIGEVEAKLYKDGRNLSGKMKWHFARPQADMNERLAILNSQVSDQGDFELRNGLIVMVSGEKQKVIGTNGQLLRLPKDRCIITWPADVKRLEVTFKGDKKKENISLLPLYEKALSAPAQKK